MLAGLFLNSFSLYGALLHMRNAGSSGVVVGGLCIVILPGSSPGGSRVIRSGDGVVEEKLIYLIRNIRLD